MRDKLKKYMKWDEIHSLAISVHNRPHNLLGQQLVKHGLLITAYLPTAVSVNVKDTRSKKLYPMEKMDDCGYFAVLIDSDKKSHTSML